MFATAMIAAGLTAFLSGNGIVVAAGFPMLGAGLFAPFGRTWFGAFVGAMVIAQFVVLAALYWWLLYGRP